MIAGLGLVTPLGHSAWQTFRALLEGRRISDRAAALGAGDGGCDPMALVRAVGCCAVSPHSATDPAVELAERAARSALDEARLEPEEPKVWLGVSKGAMAALSEAADIFNTSLPASDRVAQARRPLVGALGPAGWMGAELSRRLGCRLPRTMVAACASSLTALDAARRDLLRGPVGRAALVVTAEASLLPMFVHSYRRLGVLPRLTADAYRALPLDERRGGFVLSEQAAAVVLRAVDVVEPGQIELVDTATASEAHHVVLPAPGMPALAQLARRLLCGRDIDLLHPHATGTQDNDATELAALLPHVPRDADVYACKGALGHGLGAAGLTALVIACLCARSERRPPMSWLDQPISCGRALQRDSDRHRCFRRQAVFAAGFGGHVAGAVIECRCS